MHFSDRVRGCASHMTNTILVISGIVRYKTRSVRRTPSCATDKRPNFYDFLHFFPPVQRLARPCSVMLENSLRARPILFRQWIENKKKTVLGKKKKTFWKRQEVLTAYTAFCTDNIAMNPTQLVGVNQSRRLGDPWRVLLSFILFSVTVFPHRRMAHRTIIVRHRIARSYHGKHVGGGGGGGCTGIR